MGCSNKDGKKGCTSRKDDLLDAVDNALDYWYPTRVWGEMRNEFGRGPSFEEVQDVAELLQENLGLATWAVQGGESDYCDFVYVLCIGRQPAIGMVRDLGVQSTVDIAEGSSDVCLRIAFSHLERMAAVQQVTISVSEGDGFLQVIEARRSGVYDAPLLKRFRKLVASLESLDFRHIDMGEVSHPPKEFETGSYVDALSDSPDIVNFLFFTQSAETTQTTFLPEPNT